jgi:hypothetical protein
MSDADRETAPRLTAAAAGVQVAPDDFEAVIKRRKEELEATE